MAKLGSKSRAWLKGAHVLFMSGWVGAGICMFLLNLGARSTEGYELHGAIAMIKLIDDWVVIPSAIGSLLTGLLISWMTPWGFFKWRWVTLKWILTVAMVLFGSFCLGPWLNEMEALANADPLSVLQNPVFLGDRQLLTWTVIPMLVAMLFQIFISVLKPWRRTRTG